MITEDELARTAGRLRGALTAAADAMGEFDAAANRTPVPQRPGRPRRARAWLVPVQRQELFCRACGTILQVRH